MFTSVSFHISAAYSGGTTVKGFPYEAYQTGKVDFRLVGLPDGITLKRLASLGIGKLEAIVAHTSEICIVQGKYPIFVNLVVPVIHTCVCNVSNAVFAQAHLGSVVLCVSIIVCVCVCVCGGGGDYT